MNIVFLQKNTKKAGAQHALLRLLSTQAIKSHNILVVCGSEGWLTKELEDLGIKVIIKKFPSYKSLFGKMFMVDFWAMSIKKSLLKEKFSPHIIQANNHIESIYTLKLAKSFFGIPKTAVFFRDSHISSKEYFAYHCNDIQIKLCVSIFMKNLMSYCEECQVINDGLFKKEFFDIKDKNLVFPKKVLLLGGPHSEKGWDIFFKVLSTIYKQFDLNIFNEIVTTGIPSEAQKKQYEIKFTSNVIFHEKFENLAEEARKFDLVIFPSKRESFGLAALEVIAAGVPIFSSKTGVLSKVICFDELLFNIDNENEFQNKLLNLYYNWGNINFDLKMQQSFILDHFMIENQMEKLISLYEKE